MQCDSYSKMIQATRSVAGSNKIFYCKLLSWKRVLRTILNNRIIIKQCSKMKARLVLL